MKISNLFTTAILFFTITISALNGYAQVKKYSDSSTESNQVLPINLLSFSIKSDEPNKIIAKWATSNEANNSHFNIYIAAKNSLHFVKLGQIQGKGNSSIQQDYQFVIHNISSITLNGSLPFLLFLLIPSFRSKMLRFAIFTAFAIVGISCAKKEIAPEKKLKSFYLKLEQVDYDGKVTTFYTHPTTVEITKS